MHKEYKVTPAQLACKEYKATQELLVHKVFREIPALRGSKAILALLEHRDLQVPRELQDF